MKIKMKASTLTLFKVTNFGLILTLVILVSACSTLKTMKPTKDKTAVLTTSTGGRVEISDLNSKKQPAKIKHVIFNKRTRLCKKNPKSENLAIKQEELDLELSFMINSLSNQELTVSKKGSSYRLLSKNMMTNLYNTPNCPKFRYKLHIISKLLKGHQLVSMQ